MANSSLAGVEQNTPFRVKTLQRESDFTIGIPAKPVRRSKGKVVSPVSIL
jgi:hypothetical protein